MANLKPVYVVGHRNPDTDSICSAIAYAFLKRHQGLNALAVRTGNVNQETQFALDYFHVDAPPFVSDLYPRVRDIMTPCRSIVRETDTLRHLGRILNVENLRSMPVVNQRGTLTGIVTVSDLAQRYFEEMMMTNLADSEISIQAIVKGIDGKILSAPHHDEEEQEHDFQKIIQGKAAIAAGSLSTIARTVKEGDVAIVGDRDDRFLLACLNHNIACLIITNDGKLSPTLEAEAKNKGTVVIGTRFDTYTTARLLNQCVPVRKIMHKQVTCFEPNEMLSNIRNTIEATNYRNYPVLEDGKIVGLISRDNLIAEKTERVILVDHNERTQAIEGIENAQILEIIDHHRLGGMQTGEPIYIRQEPVGCTATIIAGIFWQHNIKIPKQIAGLLLSAIISDTVLFKSPTCTPQDKMTVERLAAIAGVDYQKYGMDMLKAGSGLGDLSPKEIIQKDLKSFQIGDYTLLVGQVSVIDTADTMTQKPLLIETMKAMCEEMHCDMVLLMITDIIKEGTELLFVGSPKTLIGEAFKQDASGDQIYLPGVMSRKKQIVPPLSDAVARLTKK